MLRLHSKRQLVRLIPNFCLSACNAAAAAAAAASNASQCLPAAAAAVLAQQQHAGISSNGSRQLWKQLEHLQQQQQQAVRNQKGRAAALMQPGNADGITQPQQAAAVSSYRLQEPFQQQQLLQHIGAPWRTQQYSLAAAASRGQQQQQHLSQHPWQHPWQQWQQQRGLLGVVKHKNYQDHNKTKPKKTKIKTPSMARRRVVVGEDGVMWRMQAGRRHKRYKKSKKRLLSLKGMVPLHGAEAAKLRKLGFKRKWWYHLKA